MKKDQLPIDIYSKKILKKGRNLKMAFKIYKNKVTGHSSISIKQNDKKRWHNLPMSHKKPKDSFIEIQDPHPKPNLEIKAM